MKKLYLIFFGINIFLVQAQQVSIMQPALNNHNARLDSVYVKHFDIIRNNSDTEGLISKWVSEEFDANGNPTNLIIYSYNSWEYMGQPIDSLRVILEHFSDNKFQSLNKKSKMNGAQYWLNNDDYNSSGVYKFFGLKTITEERFFEDTNQWEIIAFEENIGDLRIPDDLIMVNKQIKHYDYNNQFLNEIKIEGSVDLNGYLLERTTYQWNSDTNQLDFVFNDKYYNTYYLNSKIQQIIKKKITDLNTNEEKNIIKYNFNNDESFFEFTVNNWDEDTNQWLQAHQKVTIEYENNTPTRYTKYNFSEGEWVIEQEYGVTNYYSGYSYTIPTMGSGSYSLIYTQENLLTNEIDSFINDDASSGNYDEKIFYYNIETHPLQTNNYASKKLSIYPNPATNQINVTLETLTDYVIYTVLGKIIKQGKTTNHINVSKLQTGIYFIKFKTENGFINKQFIIK